MASRISELNALTALAAGDYFPVVDITETAGTADRNKRITATNLATLMSTLVDHDTLTNFVADEHVAHTGVEIATAATSGIAGGGDITATRNLSLAIDTMTAETDVDAADVIAFYDDSGAAHRKTTIKNLLKRDVVQLTVVTSGAGVGEINATDAYAIPANAGVIELTLEDDWVPSAITGWEADREVVFKFFQSGSPTYPYNFTAPAKVSTDDGVAIILKNTTALVFDRVDAVGVDSDNGQLATPIYGTSAQIA